MLLVDRLCPGDAMQSADAINQMKLEAKRAGKLHSLRRNCSLLLFVTVCFEIVSRYFKLVFVFMVIWKMQLVFVLIFYLDLRPTRNGIRL
jgi:hypothetical protein